VASAAFESGRSAGLRGASAAAELTDGAARTVKDNLVLLLAVVVDFDNVCPPTARARI
jgi:hypothetical protein